MTSYAHSRRTWGGSVQLNFPYNRELIDVLKAEIPANARSWDGLAKTWTVHPPHGQRAETLVRRYYPTMQVSEFSDRRSNPTPTPLRPEASALAELHLLPSAPDIVVEAVYRVLSKEAHPDRGGSDERQRALNVAVGILRKRCAS
jgi:hypothetical protein